MARRPRTVFLAVLGVSVVAGTFLYLSTRTTWRTASAAEIRAEIDPSLLEPVTIDPKALDRYNRVEAAARGLEGEWNAHASLISLTARDLVKVDEIERILNEGSLQKPLPSWSVNLSNRSSRFTVAVRILSRVAAVEADAGRTDSAAHLFRIALRLAFGFADHLSYREDAIVRDHRVGIVFEPLYPRMGKFDDRQLETLADAIPPAPLVDEGLKRAVRAEFQNLWLPLLPDPVAWSEEMRGKLAPEFENSFAAHLAEKNRIGSYDAIETARQMNRNLLEIMANAGRRQVEQVDASEQRIRFLQILLPRDQSRGARGAWIPVRNLQYRVRMARTPNSFAHLEILPLLLGQGELMKGARLGRTTREGIRTLLALHRYRHHHGTPAPNLESLVREKLLPALPIDFRGKGNLHYNAARHRLWSAGENAVDDGGFATKFNDPTTLDQVWETP